MSVLASGVPLYCPHKSCGWSYDNAGKRGQDYLATHLRVIHKGDDPRLPVLEEVGHGKEQEASVQQTARASEAAAAAAQQPRREAAVTGPRPTWTRESAIVALQACAERLGRTPSSEDAKRANEFGIPTWPAAGRLFGTWPAFIDAAGLKPLRRGRRVLSEREPQGRETGVVPSASSPIEVTAAATAPRVVLGDSPEQRSSAERWSRSESTTPPPGLTRALIAAGRAFLDTLEKEIR